MTERQRWFISVTYQDPDDDKPTTAQWLEEGHISDILFLIETAYGGSVSTLIEATIRPINPTPLAEEKPSHV